MELKIEHISKQFKDKTAVDDVSLTLTTGVWGLLGANGAGKTTLMRMIADIMTPSSGSISFDGEDIIRIVTPFYRRNDPNGAAAEIVKEATNLWEKDGIERDDITVIISFIGQTSKKTLLKKETY